MLKAENSLGIIFFPAFDWAISPTHPEREERLLYTQDQLREEGLFDIEGIREYKPEVAETLDIERVHFCFPEAEAVATRSHYISAGGAIKAAELVMQGERDRAFALVRPPGHHAMKTVQGSRGFCTINIEAIMCEYIREKYGPKRIAIVDTDCHHGDGTQDVYWHDPDTLFISMHQDGRTLYPGTGFPKEAGGPKALGKNINIPLPPGTSDAGFMKVMEDLVMPILDDFKPDLIINSAGQDNHFTDPITNMNFSSQGYAALNSMLKPDIAVLEGGYAIQGALPYVNLGISLAIAGVDYSHVREPGWNPEKLKETDEIMDYIGTLCEGVKEIYFNPPTKSNEGVITGNWSVRHRNIFYDTEGFTESQTESLLLCDECRGLLKVETQKENGPMGFGIEIPASACDKCRNTGYSLLEEAQVKSRYRYMQMINRKDKDYLRYGF
ncbi:histone deacetylase family protein [Maridesulfovibrio hydrothermalis]|uniref:Histone deacetylase n=1 Tax=Maridesulfovibrio hydrothermalis AM13 = DSM 14728 TaxID=1121451 RepID=L0RAV9_9BACT|nr:histone deacetylase [Maridesulfovibrio hydrothermalis]CCO23357.1 Histone deacetylase [Maridesulfovibrio hydrothermalis AM13 = DSM 14728]